MGVGLRRGLERGNINTRRERFRVRVRVRARIGVRVTSIDGILGRETPMPRNQERDGNFLYLFVGKMYKKTVTGQ